MSECSGDTARIYCGFVHVDVFKGGCVACHLESIILSAPSHATAIFVFSHCIEDTINSGEACIVGIFEVVGHHMLRALFACQQEVSGKSYQTEEN